MADTSMEELGTPYNPDEEELREAVEKGRRYKIAAEVWREFLNDRREEIIQNFEQGNYGEDNDKFNETLAELRIIIKFRDMSTAMINVGEIAEEALREYGE